MDDNKRRIKQLKTQIMADIIGWKATSTVSFANIQTLIFQKYNVKVPLTTVKDWLRNSIEGIKENNNTNNDKPTGRLSRKMPKSTKNREDTLLLTGSVNQKYIPPESKLICALELLKKELETSSKSMSAQDRLHYLSNVLYFDDMSIVLSANSMLKRRLNDLENGRPTSKYEITLLKEIRKAYGVNPVDGLKLLDWARLIETTDGVIS
jgi:hypothetical protein